MSFEEYKTNKIDTFDPLWPTEIPALQCKLKSNTRKGVCGITACSIGYIVHPQANGNFSCCGKLSVKKRAFINKRLIGRQRIKYRYESQWCVAASVATGDVAVLTDDRRW